MLMVKPSSVNNAEVLARLWIHECSRVFADRLITAADRAWFQDTVYEMVIRNFRVFGL
jgi:dynein heavy chain